MSRKRMPTDILLLYFFCTENSLPPLITKKRAMHPKIIGRKNESRKMLSIVPEKLPTDRRIIPQAKGTRTNILIKIVFNIFLY